MPRDQAKRGKRGGSKRKRDGEGSERLSKRRKDAGEGLESEEYTGRNDVLPAGFEQDNIPEEALAQGAPFFGLLDSEEQDYFRRIDELLQRDAFDSAEDRRVLIQNTLKEAEGKELKIACSQSPSRLMEKLIAQTSPAEFHRLAHTLIPQWLHLMSHRFASHCCEAILSRAAGLVSSISSKSAKKASGRKSKDHAANGSTEEGESSPVDLVLSITEAMSGQYGWSLDDKYASHVLQALVSLLALPLGQDKENSPRREKAPAEEDKSEKADSSKDSVTERFGEALRHIADETLSELETSTLQALVSRPYAGPVIRVILKSELIHGKVEKLPESTIYKTLFPDGFQAEDSVSRRFLNGMLFDPVGSHLIETLVESCDGKTFKQLFRTVFKPEMARLSKKYLAAFVVSKILARLSGADLEECRASILPQLTSAVESPQTLIVRALIERSTARGLSTEPIAAFLSSLYPLSPRVNLVLGLLQMNTSPAPPAPNPDAASTDDLQKQRLNGSLLAQAMCQSASGPLPVLIHSSLEALEPQTLNNISADPIATHVLQTALASVSTTKPFRRKILNSFLALPAGTTDGGAVAGADPAADGIVAMGLHPVASHVVDLLLSVSSDLPHLRQRLAERLVQGETLLRTDFVGKKVWRNWMLDLYQRNVGLWLGRTGLQSSVIGGQMGTGAVGEGARGAGGAEGRGTGAGTGAGGVVKRSEAVATRTGTAGLPQKTSIELAAERFAARRQSKRAMHPSRQRVLLGPVSSVAVG